MTANDFSLYINIALGFFGVCLLIGGVFVIRKGYSKETSEAMERLNTTLDKEIEVLRRRVESLEKDRSTQDRVLATIRHVLKENNLILVINGDFVTLRNKKSGKSTTTRIQDNPTVDLAGDDDDDTDAV